ncbi:alpha/beta fold hydrolase [Nevskia sp.]|uniref:alpha/beta fold hydrolase n=1 Tax=Nevskia sp. TaxID=1929292 RepID=UPI0025F57546|nr:alpha/beta fold hydrolase [Nevskia sp.]
MHNADDASPTIPEHLLVFAHGKESGPWGTKIRHLAETAKAQGYAVLSPDYRQQPDPDLRVAQFIEQAPKARRAVVLAGSSMGGYVSAMAAGAIQPDALFLIAPALYFPGYDREPPVPPALTRVVHGWSDEVVTPDKAIRFAAKHRLPLTMLDAGHTLNERLPELSALLGDLLERAKLHAAYRLAQYRIGDRIERRIGMVDDAADRELAALGVTRSWAIVSACNPLGIAVDEAANAAACVALRAALGERGIRHLPAAGHDPDGRWPAEASELLIDPPDGVAAELGRQFGQNAVVAGVPGAAPTLVWLR